LGIGNWELGIENWELGIDAEGVMTLRTAVKGEEIMTDFQFKALMSMVLDIMNRSVDLEDAKRAIGKLAGELSEDEAEKASRLKE
jgi:hypothetical protein